MRASANPEARKLSFDHQPTGFTDVSFALGGVNHDIRRLTTGVVAVSGDCPTIQDIADSLRELGADQLHEVTHSLIRNHVEHTPPEVIDFERYEETDTVCITRLTGLSVAIGGVMLEELGGINTVGGLQSLVGGFKLVNNKGERVFPGPGLRYLIYDRFISEGGSFQGSKLAPKFVKIGSTRDALRGQLDQLVDQGYVTEGPKKGTSPITYTLDPAKRPFIRDYVSIVKSFISSHDRCIDGIDTIEGYLDPEDDRSYGVPYDVRNAMHNSPKRNAPLSQALNEYLLNLRAEGTTEVSTATLAEKYGYTTKRMYDLLKYMSTSPDFNVRRVGERGRNSKGQGVSAKWSIFSCLDE